MAARLILARATTIAIRYCAVRRQFRPKDADASQPETAVLDYTTVQIRLFPLLATSYALHYSGKMMGEVYDRSRSGVDRGDLSGLADMHALSSGLKSLSTELAANGIEVCRRAMGGHGFGGASGLVAMNADYLSKPTVEGDNWMISQQMSRALLKKAKRIVSEPDLVPANRTERSLQAFRQKSRGQTSGPYFDVLGSDEALVAAFEHRASYLVSCMTSYHGDDGAKHSRLSKSTSSRKYKVVIGIACSSNYTT